MNNQNKIDELNRLIEQRASIINILKQKESLSNISSNSDVNFVNQFETLLNKCKEYDSKIKIYKNDLPKESFLKIEDEKQSYESNSETALMVAEENKMIKWFKKKINEIKFNYNLERAVKRDNYFEANIIEQISSFNTYLNVIKANGNKAIFVKKLDKVVDFNKG